MNHTLMLVYICACRIGVIPVRWAIHIYQKAWAKWFINKVGQSRASIL